MHLKILDSLCYFLTNLIPVIIFSLDNFRTAFYTTNLTMEAPSERRDQLPFYLPKIRGRLGTLLRKLPDEILQRIFMMVLADSTLPAFTAQSDVRGVRLAFQLR